MELFIIRGMAATVLFIIQTVIAETENGYLQDKLKRSMVQKALSVMHLVSRKKIILSIVMMMIMIGRINKKIKTGEVKTKIKRRKANTTTIANSLNLYNIEVYYLYPNILSML
jgi:hypothetical protein